MMRKQFDWQTLLIAVCYLFFIALLIKWGG